MEVSSLITISGFIFSIISTIICIVTFIKNGNKDTKQDASDTSYRQGQIDIQLKQIFQKLEKIESKIDTYDQEIESRIEKAITQHVETWHKHHENE